MAEKYLKIGPDGTPVEEEAKVASAGAGDAGKIPALDSSGRLDSSTMPAGVGQNTSTIPASEALSAGDMVNIYDNAGVANVRKADNSNARRAHGFVLAPVAAAANATVYGPGDLITGLSGLTIGAEYLLGTAGAVSTAVPTATGAIVQSIGVAESDSAVRFSPKLPIKRA